MQKLISYNYLYLVPLIFSSLASLRSFGVARLKIYRPFSVFLLVTVGVEAFAITWKWYLFHTAYWNLPKTNLWIYNAFLPARLIFLAWFFYRQVSARRFKRILGIVIVPVTVFNVINYCWIQLPDEVDNYSIVADHILFVLMSLAYFHQVLHDDRIMLLRTQPMVWISLGTLLYYSGTTPFFIFLEYLSKHNLPLAISLLYINHALNTLMYTFYLISFLCKPRFLL
jgi:hypothetical protein